MRGTLHVVAAEDVRWLLALVGPVFASANRARHAQLGLDDAVKAHLARGGRVDGNITSKALVVEEGAIFHGQSIMDATAGSATAPDRAGSHPSTAAQGSGQSDKAEHVKVP